MVDITRLGPLIKDLSEYDQHAIENLFLEMIWDSTETNLKLFDAINNIVCELETSGISVELPEGFNDFYYQQLENSCKTSIQMYEDNLEKMRTSDRWTPSNNN